MAADYSKSELERMQREAVRRVKEMQERARGAGQGGPNGTPSPGEDAPLRMPHFLRAPSGREEPPARVETPAAPGHAQTPRAPEHRSSAPRTKGFDLLRMLNLRNLQMDADRSVVLMLLTLLSGEETDELLLLALLYIML